MLPERSTRMNTVGICGMNVRSACWQPRPGSPLTPGSNEEKSGGSKPARLLVSGAGVSAEGAGFSPAGLALPGASAGAEASFERDAGRDVSGASLAPPIGSALAGASPLALHAETPALSATTH